MILLQQDVLMAKIAALMLVSVRLAALILAAPILSANAISTPVRIALTMLLAMALAARVSVPAIDLATPAGALVVAREALIGAALGLIFQIGFAAVALAGEQIAASMGLGFASMMDPQSGASSQVVTQFLTVLFTLLFLASESHHVLLRQAAASYAALPIGAEFGFKLADNILRAAALIFSGALVIAAPVVMLLFLVNLVVGFMTRAAPQMNIFSIGFPVTILAGFGLLAISLPAAMQAMARLLESLAAIARDAILRGAPT